MKTNIGPPIKTFDGKPYEDLISGLTEHMDGKLFENACTPIVMGILSKQEEFEKLENGPSYNGTPFDFFGFKKGSPYIIEFKGSLKSFNYPDETEKRRMQELLKSIDRLNVALLQVKLQTSEYRIYYNEDMKPLFEGKERPLANIERWIKSRF